MGYGDGSTTWPRKCFNGQKNWQLGWYSSKHLTIDPTGAPRLVKVAAFVDFPKAKEDEAVVVKVGDKLFLQYNRAKSFNIETEEKADMLTVTTTSKGMSLNLAGLNTGEAFRTRYRTSKKKQSTLIIQVCQRIDGNSTGVADILVVSIGLGRSLCNGGNGGSGQGGGSCRKKSKACTKSSQCCQDLRCVAPKKRKKKGKKAKALKQCAPCIKEKGSCRRGSDCCSGSCANRKCITGVT
jgi:hypothetical protein